ncbi:uncharacterized protein LOC126265542 isoform X1 [Aethina tumida]|uniref:uncharacterized protein LOC126265542 isoform X1 n=1 Tax=Aethina tumida TaxID=116153 RepID=UPI002148019B|nr:uncharacterized protein LOC126265542 isoform X1 [Aethina tumida]
MLGVSHFSEQNKSTLQDLIEEERRAIKAITEKMSALRLKYAREKFKNDLKYRIFHVKVAQIFAQQLIKDKKESEHSTKKISLAGKWAPSLKKHFDRYTLIGTTISTEIFKITKDLGYSPEDFPNLCFEHEECPFAKQIYLARKNYRTNYYVKLHTDLKVPEIFMTSGKWQEIEYNRVPAKCMTKNRSSFLKHDKSRFEEFIMSPYKKVAGGTLTPIQLINRAFKVMKLKPNKNIEETLLQKQWESLVESIQSKSNCLLSNAVSICDVSASMDGDPMLAAIGLTLMTLEKSNPPWNNICITFSEHPQFHKVNPDITFIEKVNSLKNMIWDANTNFDAVFDLILDLAKKNNLKQSEMPSILLVFTDMEFDEAFHKPNKTNFENAKQKFEANNYEMPNVVFWNLRAKAKGKETSPVQKDENGVLLLSGYSSKMLSYILDFTDDNFAEDISHKLTPEEFLNQVVNDERYSNLVIYD